MEILTCEQGSEEWFKARLGIPTASMFGTIMAKGRGSAPSKTRLTYLYKLAGEILTGEPMDNYTNAHMERGKAMEEEARDLYAMVTETEPKIIGFIRNDAKGASPDALIGDDGLLEIKTRLPHLQIALLLSGEIPGEHRAQLQGQLWVSERDWVDFVSYWPGLPLVRIRVERDDEYIKTLGTGVALFVVELAELTAEIRTM